MKKLIGLVIALLLTSSLVYYFLFLNHIGIGEVGIARDSRSGKMWLQDKPGWYVTDFTTKVMTVETLPFKISPFHGTRTKLINEKIIRFNPDGYEAFVDREGFGYHTGMSMTSTLAAYAYSGKPWPFLTIVEETEVFCREQ